MKATACLTLLLLFLGGARASAQEQDEAEQIVEAFFENRNRAPWQATSTCPGEDALNDAIMAVLMRPRPEEETRLLGTSWGIVPECRANQILGWYDRAFGIITSDASARSFARRVLKINQGLRLLRRAAADPSVPDEARGAYQSAVYWRLSRAEQEELFIQTFRQELQVGLYRRTGMQHLFGGPDPTGAAVRILSEVLEHPDNDQAPYVLGVVLNIAVSPRGFRPQDRQRIWDLLEPRLNSLPPEMRSAIESYEADLRGVAG
jgi:hypothetical protein